MADMLNLKKKSGWWISNRSGWLLELLTELTIAIVMIMTLDYCSLQRVEQETSGRCINVEVNRRPSMRIIRKMALNMWKSHGIEGLPFS